MHEQVFEHSHFAIEGLGVIMGPLALVGDELHQGRLAAPIREPAPRARGYYIYTRAASSGAPAVTALRQWLVSTGRSAEAEYPIYLRPRQP